MGKKKSRRDGMTDSEYRSYLKSFRLPCPKEDCDGYACTSVLSWGGYCECNDCGHKFGWVDGRGSSVTREQYKRLAEQGQNKLASRSAGMSCPAEEDEMAKGKKKGKSAAKKSGKSKVAAPKTARTPEERVKETPSGLAVSLLVTTNDDDATIGKKVVAKFPDAPATYTEAQKFRMIPHIRKRIVAGEPVYDWAKSLKGYKKPKAVEKKTVAEKPAVKKPTAKKKATKKPTAKKK